MAISALASDDECPFSLFCLHFLHVLFITRSESTTAFSAPAYASACAHLFCGKATSVKLIFKVLFYFIPPSMDQPLCLYLLSHSFHEKWKRPAAP
ncbi:hypothetical protein IJG29_01910, partial [Candidatus Saccharibacteria bacterium]|nr:hypothetical protein [Candidatus Saccharibacteria bacterium]